MDDLVQMRGEREEYTEGVEGLFYIKKRWGAAALRQSIS